MPNDCSPSPSSATSPTTKPTASYSNQPKPKTPSGTRPPWPWPAATGPRITEADVNETTGLYRKRLDTSFFRVRLDRTTDLEKAYLRAMAELGPDPTSAADVAQLLGRSSQQAGPTRATLIDRGLLYSPSHGLAAFTVPHFDQFMHRAVPHLDPPQIQPRKPLTLGRPSLPGDPTQPRISHRHLGYNWATAPSLLPGSPTHRGSRPLHHPGLHIAPGAAGARFSAGGRRRLGAGWR